MEDASSVRKKLGNRTASERGWSPQAPAHQSGLERSFTGAIERGETDLRTTTLVKLANTIFQALPMKDRPPMPIRSHVKSRLEHLRSVGSPRHWRGVLDRGAHRRARLCHLPNRWNGILVPDTNNFHFLARQKSLRAKLADCCSVVTKAEQIAACHARLDKRSYT